MAYTKFHAAWAGTDQLSGEAWNHVETQWTAIKADADAHNHDTRYYVKATADVTFFSTSYYTGFDADKLDGYHLSDMTTTVFPVGSILLWSGTDGNVPATWAICNGGSGTPDLRDYFVSGCPDDGNLGLGSPGVGPTTWNGTITPTGSVTIGDHQLSTAELPAHTHNYSEYRNALLNTYITSSNPSAEYQYNRNAENQNEGGDGVHGHTGSTISFSAIDPRPYYYAMYYIMKVS